MKYHPVFQIFLLEPAASNPLPRQKQAAPPLIIIDDNVEFQVEEILDSKLIGKTLKFLVHLVGYGKVTWEPAELLINSLKLVNYFHRKYSTKHKPHYQPQL